MISVILPYGGSDHWRQRLFEHVIERLDYCHPRLEVCVAGSTQHPFSLSEARRRAVEQANGDMFLIWDADTICNIGDLEWAIAAAWKQGYAYPFGHYFNMNEAFTRWLIDEPDSYDRTHDWPHESQYEHDLTESVSGILVIRRDIYEQANPYPEGFIGWGYEDRVAFELLNRAAGGCARKEDGFVMHLWHEAPHELTFGQPHIQHNRELYRRIMAENGLPVRVP